MLNNLSYICAVLKCIFRGIPVPIVCKNRAERISAIGKELAKGEYDIAVLEEVLVEELSASYIIVFWHSLFIVYLFCFYFSYLGD